MSYERSLRRILQDRDPELYGRLKKIEKFARSLLSYTHGKFPYYTPHDFSHSLNVEENLNWMITGSIKEKMNSYEIFFLLVAAWMHDWGMIGKPEEDPKEIREIHHLRTERYFEEMHDKLYISEHEGRNIGRICRGHTKEDLYKKDFDDVVFGSSIRIRTGFLAAILRIADECDITYNRTPEIVYYTLNPTDKAEEEFKKHLSIGGVGQLDEKHKIYISAVARDPRGASALREIRDKIQNELNTVKAILAQHGVVLDYVELRLETRGFIDKPIGFEVDKKRIVDLLIGEHLYRRRDVAIRELLQNSIDACRLRKEIEPNVSFRITLKKSADDTIEVEDNGIGMEYSTAKRFLSIVGASYYGSEEFEDFIKGKIPFDPIARFGFGIMSCFLISEGITVETKKKGFDPCRFTIESSEQAWRYEKGSLKNPGTKIVLRLADEGKMINLRETLESYFIASEIPIYYGVNSGEIRQFEVPWSMDHIVERFALLGREVTPTELLRLQTKDYRVIIGIDAGAFGGDLVLFNHGVFVDSFPLVGLSWNCAICVDAKRNLFDLQISREDVVRNKRWLDFVSNLANDLFDTLSDRFLMNQRETYFSMISRMFQAGRFKLVIKREESFDATLKKYPLIGSFLNRVFFPIMSKESLGLRRLDTIPDNDEITLYPVCSSPPFKEIGLVSEFIDKNKTTVFDPYAIPEMGIKGENKYENLLCLALKSRGIRIWKTDLSTIMIDNSSPPEAEEISTSFEDIIPRSVRLARFPRDWKPLVVIYKTPIVLQARDSLGWAYWGNILLWRILVGDRAYESLRDLPLRHMYLEDVRLLSEPTVYVDAEDEFIDRIISLRTKRTLEDKISKKIFRYFRYLSFLPLAISDLSSCLIFFETLESLEEEIADALGFDRQRPLLRRMGKIRSIYFQYLDDSRTRLYEVRKSKA